jgi:CRP/FNR family transcriptional regulator, cyclic AMP receptor protein
MPPTPAFLESLAAPERSALLAAGRTHRWSRGEMMFREGDPAGGVLILLAGLVKIHKQGRDGAEVVLTLCGPGDLLGEVAAVRDGTRSADATALQPVEALIIDMRRLRTVLERHPSLTLALLESVLARLRIADGRRIESAMTESLPRVSGRLVELAERFGRSDADGRIEVRMPINQEELASWAAASRESTARALRTLRALKLIETQRRHLVVLDLDRLRAHSNQR